MSYKYILKGKEVVPAASLEEWAMYFEHGEDLKVKQEHIGTVFISTVFIGLDASMSNPPRVFETMAFGQDDSEYIGPERSATWDEAVATHEAMATQIRNEQAKALPMKNPVTLFYDVETSGLIRDHKLPSDDPSHPHITQISACLRDAAGEEWGAMNRYIKPDGWALDAGILAFNARAGNGITQDFLEHEGVPIAEAMAEFFNLLRSADVVVEWDKFMLARMIRIEAKRLRLDEEAESFKAADNRPLNKACVNICRIPKAKGDGFKQPTLQEAHQFFFNAPMPAMNNSRTDTLAIMAIYNRLLQSPDFMWPAGEAE